MDLISNHSKCARGELLEQKASMRHPILWCKNMREPTSGTRDRDIPMNSDRSLGSTTSQKVASSIVSRGARCCKTNFCWGTCSSNPHDPPGYSHPPTCSSQWFTWSYFLHWFLSMLWSKTMVITCVLWIVEAPPNKKRKGKKKDKKKNEKDKNDWVTYYGYASKSSNRGGLFWKCTCTVPILSLEVLHVAWHVEVYVDGPRT